MWRVVTPMSSPLTNLVENCLFGGLGVRRWWFNPGRNWTRKIGSWRIRNSRECRWHTETGGLYGSWWGEQQQGPLGAAAWILPVRLTCPQQQMGRSISGEVYPTAGKSWAKSLKHTTRTATMFGEWSFQWTNPLCSPTKITSCDMRRGTKCRNSHLKAWATEAFSDTKEK